jgi:hypothetical protein
VCWLQVFKIQFHVKHASSISNTWHGKVGDATTCCSIHLKLFNAQNPAAVAELEHAVHEMDTTAELATTSSPFTGKCGDKT